MCGEYRNIAPGCQTWGFQGPSAFNLARGYLLWIHILLIDPRGESRTAAE
jgi:hypothetical protein